MSAQNVAEIILLVLLLLFSIFTSLSETALISVSRIKLRQRMSEGSGLAKMALRILEVPEKLFGTVLVGNNIANLLAASLATAIAIDLIGKEENAIAAATIVMTTLVIIGEVTSKTIAAKKSEKMSLAVVVPVRILIWMFTPVVWVFTLITRLIVKFFGISFKESKSLVTEEEIKALIRIGEQEGSIAREEGQMLQKIFRFGDMTAREAMTPLSNMVSINLNATYDEIMQFVVEAGYSRLPVYREELQNVVGIVQVKDILNFWENRSLIILQDVMDPPTFVPESKRLNDLLKEFQRGKSHMSIVIDAKGKVVGLVTLEDIIEEIVGEIEDEYDARFTEIEETAPDTYATSGYCRVQKVNEVLQVDLPAKEFVTLNGFMIYSLGHVPKEGESVQMGSIICVANKVEGHRVIRVEIHKKV